MAVFLGRPLDYRACEQDELRRFVRDRTKGQPANNASKEQLVAKLGALDQEATFPFEGLPAELRIKVYEDLVFHPQILRVSKPIYKEAKQVLDRQASATKLVIGREETNTGSKDFINIEGGPKIWLPNEDPQLHTLARQLATWPSEILSSSHISIHIKDLTATRRTLYQLASIIGNTQVEICIRARDVHCGGPLTPCQGKSLLRDHFWSLQCMGPRAEVSLQGFRSDAVQSLRQVFTAHASTRTNLFAYIRFIGHLEETLDLAKQAGVCIIPIYSLLYMARNADISATHCYDHVLREGRFGQDLKILQRIAHEPQCARVRAEALSVLAARAADTEAEQTHMK
ncbi:hypothetical protein BST61_g10359 [Cercospora zeina]